ncbi:MAG: class I SAM-dependent methyltransferase, partial [Vicingaceae bacterium]
MNSFCKVPKKIVELPEGQQVYDFSAQSNNIDLKTVKSFGEEWGKFDTFSEEEIKNAGDQYFDIINEQMLNKDSVVLDMGCGSGRWTKYVANNANQGLINDINAAANLP